MFQICNVDMYSILRHVLLTRTQDLGQTKSGVAKSNPSIRNAYFREACISARLRWEFLERCDLLLKCRVNENT